MLLHNRYIAAKCYKCDMTSSYTSLLVAAYRGKPLKDILSASPSALRGISASGAEALTQALGIRTVAQLAESRHHRAAQTLLAAAGRPPFDPGPPLPWLDQFARAPLEYYVTHSKRRFRVQFGPVYYRGRLDGTARVLVVGQDPSTNELLAQRAFVGLSGQRVQGLLARIGITRSYTVTNTFLFPVFGQFDAQLRRISLEPPIIEYRNACLDRLRAENPLEAVIAFGAAPRHAVEHWPGGEGLPTFFLTHPAAEDRFVLRNWSGHLEGMAAAITPDPDGTVDLTPYGSAFRETDTMPIPRFDLPFGLPEWHGGSGGSSMRDGNQRIIWTSPVP
jgi:uracil-DNA glycosylase